MNYPAGIFILIFCAIGYWFSWKNFNNQKKIIALFVLVLIGFILRLYLSSDFFLHAWDERYHALVAKNMMQHPLIPTLYNNPVFPYDYANWTGNHIWLHKQPMPLWTMSLSMSWFGVNEIALRIPSILMSTFGILITYRISKHFFNTRTSFMAAFLFSINGLIIELTSGRVTTDHIDIHFMFFIQLAVLLALEFAKHKRILFNILCGVFIAAAILTKWLPALIVLPIWLGAQIYYKKYSLKHVLVHFSFLIAIITLFVLPWQIYIYTYFPQEAAWEAEQQRLHLTTVVEGQSGPFYYYLEKVRLIFGEIMLLALLFLLILNIKKRRNIKFWIFSVWIFVPILFFSFAATKMQGYIMMSAPPIFIIGSYFWNFLKMTRSKYNYKWAVSLILILFIILPIRYTIERLKPFDKSERNPVWVTQLKALGQKTKNEKGIIFNISHPIEALFYTDLTAYEHLPSPAVFDSLVDKGYAIYINEGDNVSDEMYSDHRFQRVLIFDGGK